MKLPLYKAKLAEGVAGVTAVSLVKYPAVESDFITFAAEGKKIDFTSDEEKHNIIGCVLRADYPIYRRDGEYEYYVEFDTGTIEAIAKKMFKDQSYAVNNEQHDATKDISEKIETMGYFLKDTEKGIAPSGFDDVADGSLFAVYHIADEDVWQDIKDGKMKGFSVETILQYIEVEDTIDPEEEEILGLIEQLKSKIK